MPQKWCKVVDKLITLLITTKKYEKGENKPCSWVNIITQLMLKAD